jgi:transposase-like protein
MYPVVFFDALRVKIRHEAMVVSKAVYLALAILPDGTRDILGLWIEQTEGAKFWMKVFTDLKTRGCQDIWIAVTDGLKGMSEALAAIYPQTTLQTCIVHLLRHSLDYAAWKERKTLAAALRPIYTAPTARPPARRSTRSSAAAGHPVSDRCRVVATGLDAGDSVLRVRAGDSSGDLHDQRARECPRTAS